MKKINFSFKHNLKIGIFSFSAIFFLYLLYLSLPSLYDTGRVQKALYEGLSDETGLNFSLSSDITYRILPKPHFYIQDTKMFNDQLNVSNEIGEIKNLRVFISQKNLFNGKDLTIKKVIISNANFFVKRQNIDIIKNIFENPFSEKKVFVKKSKFFFNDKNGNTVFIYSINDLNFYRDSKENNKIFKTNGNIFKIPIKFEWIKNLNNRNTSSTFKANKIDIDFTNKGNFLNGKYNYENNLNVLSNNFKTIYKIEKNKIKIDSKKSFIKNTPISFQGLIELSPFNFYFNLIAKDIDLEYFFKNTNFLNELLLSNILLNQNLNGRIKIKTDKIYNSKIFTNGEINITFEEGSFNFNNSYIENKEFSKLYLNETKFVNENEKIFLIGSLKLDIYNINQFYRIFPVKKSKKLKRDFKKIIFNFSFNLSESQFSIDKISFIDKNNKISQSQDADNIIENNYKIKFSLSNSILFKNFMKKVLVAYLDEG
mgnify:CR=1 FL=1|tara:strand:- start:783 stop:2231 length:1449 start_codon:yes stop_codon:yes gene_type:complete